MILLYSSNWPSTVITALITEHLFQALGYAHWPLHPTLKHSRGFLPIRLASLPLCPFSSTPSTPPENLLMWTSLHQIVALPLSFPALWFFSHITVTYVHVDESWGEHYHAYLLK